MVNSAWCIAYGTWFMVHSPWSLVHSTWSRVPLSPSPWYHRVPLGTQFPVVRDNPDLWDKVVFKSTQSIHIIPWTRDSTRHSQLWRGIIWINYLLKEIHLLIFARSHEVWVQNTAFCESDNIWLEQTRHLWRVLNMSWFCLDSLWIYIYSYIYIRIHIYNLPIWTVHLNLRF